MAVKSICSDCSIVPNGWAQQIFEIYQTPVGGVVGVTIPGFPTNDFYWTYLSGTLQQFCQDFVNAFNSTHSTYATAQLIGTNRIVLRWNIAVWAQLFGTNLCGDPLQPVISFETGLIGAVIQGINCGCACDNDVPFFIPANFGDNWKLWLNKPTTPPGSDIANLELWLCKAGQPFAQMNYNTNTLLADSQTIVANFTFPVNVPAGYYQLCWVYEGFVLGCFAQIHLANHCFTSLFRYRNNEDAFGFKWSLSSEYQQLRMPFILENDMRNSTSVISQASSGQWRNLYTRLTEQWELDSDYLDASSRLLIDYAAACDTFEIWNEDKFEWVAFVVVGGITAKSKDTYPRYPLQKIAGKFNTKNFDAVNAACVGL